MPFINRTLNISDLNKFNDEVKAHNTKIECVLKFGDDDLRFSLSEAFTVQEHTDLDLFISSFVDRNPEDLIPKIMDMTNEYSKHFHAINYVKGLNQSLIPKRTVTQGEVTKVEWFRTINQSQEPEDLVLKVDVSYTRDVTGFATFRTTTRTWINRDESDNTETKVTQKYYFINPSDMIEEGLKRRKLLVSTIQIPVMKFMIEVLTPLGYSQEAVVLKGRAFLDEYETDFNKFIDNSSTITDPADPDVGMKTVVVKLRDETRNDYIEWLDKAPGSIGGMTTIRQYLISEFDI